MSQWEKVGKNKPKTKTQKQKEADMMPKQSYEVTPLEISKTAFEALGEKSKKGTLSKQPLQDRSNGQNSPKAGGKKNKKQKKVQPTSKFRHESFEKAVREVSVTEVRERARKIEGNSVWQKEIISLINDAISCPEEDPTLSSRRDIYFPLSAVNEPLNDMMKKMYVDDASESIRQIIFDHCMLTLWDLVERDVPTWGYRLCIQVMAKYAPDNCVDDLQRHVNKIRNGQNNPKKCLSYMWAVGQIGVGDVRLGMQVWLTVMLPFLGVKKLAGYVVSYLESLLETSKNPQKDLGGTIDVEHFLQIMMWTFDPSNGLDTGLRNKMKFHFGTVKMIATGTENLQLALFKKFLRTHINEIAKVDPTFVEITWECTKDNPDCFEAWSNSYASSLPQTKMLLEYVEMKWKKLKIPSGFQELVCRFEKENQDAACASSPLTSAPEFKAVRKSCQNLKLKFNKKSTEIRSMCNTLFCSTFIVLLAIGAGLFIHDLKLHGNKVEQTMTYRTLKNSGVLDIMIHIWDTTTTFTEYIFKWLQKNIPYYWSIFSDVFGPYLLYISSRLSALGSWLVEVSVPYRAAITTYTEHFLVYVDKAAGNAGPYLLNTLNRLNPYFVAVSKWLDAKLMAFFSFLNGDFGWCCVRDSVMETASYLYQIIAEICLSVWSYLLYLGKLIGDYVSGENMN